jgi:hypothetical protein
VTWKQASGCALSVGVKVQVTALHHYAKRQRTYDLTIDGIHAYYVLAGDTPLLVHNCGGTEAGARQLMARATQLQSEVGWSGTTAVVRVRNLLIPVEWRPG